MSDIAADRAGRIVDELRMKLRGDSGIERMKDSTAIWLERKIAEEIRGVGNVGTVVELGSSGA